MATHPTDPITPTAPSPIDAEEWAVLRALVEAALQIDPEHRVDFLRQKSPDERLYQEALQLLDCDADSNDLFAPHQWTQWAASLDLASAAPGTLVGNYRIEAELGHGGMGTVYRATRADGIYDQQVAIKILQGGNLTPYLIRRFGTERQILARLSHPGIARLLDGGILADGRQYLVLEFVDGIPIDHFCDHHHLDMEARLKLFLKAAEAVQSAHQQFVLHLDIKPANILVTPLAEPRLLDFGISRLASETTTDGALADATTQILTPSFASPEQASGRPMGVASDVFSLATLLYKLLTGRLPYAIEQATPIEAARILCQVAPALPSSVAPPAFASALRGDLDTILLQALRKEPERRYPTVAAFCEDIERHLRSEPVTAHADSLAYRSAKFLRRNRVSTIVTAIAAIAVVATTAVAIRSAVAARRQRATAVRRLSDVRGLAHSYIFDLVPELQSFSGTLKVRNEVVQRALGYLQAMSRETDADPETERELALGYFTIGRLQGAQYAKSLGDRSSALDSFSRGLAIQQKLAATDPSNPKDAGLTARILIEMANLHIVSGDIETGQLLLEQAWRLAQPAIAAGPSSPYFLNAANVAWHLSMNASGDGRWNLASPQQGLRWAQTNRTMLEQYARAHPEAMQEPGFLSTLCTARSSEADALVLLGRDDEAFALVRDSLPYFDTDPPQQDQTSLETRRFVHNHYARMLVDRGDLRQATALSAILRPEERRETRETVGRSLWEKIALAGTIEWTANIDWRNGKTALAHQEMAETLRIFRELNKQEPDLIWPLTGLHDALLEFATLPGMKPVDAAPMFREALAISSNYRAQHPAVGSASLAQARAHAGLQQVALKQKHPEEAAKEARAVRETLAPLLSAHPDLIAAKRLVEAASH